MCLYLDKRELEDSAEVVQISAKKNAQTQCET